MVPKLHKRGTSFKGVAAYLLHDKDRATTSGRVAWTDVRNITVKDPQLASRIMAATALDQNRLKSEAGIKTTGRKSNESVLHLSLAWHPDEAKGLNRDEMLRAATGAIRALGAEGRQALIVSHNDEKQPHVHIVINRVSPEDGRMLASSKEKENLSLWAEAYEKERGAILCQQRSVNNAARKRREFVRGKKDRPRHLYELEQGAVGKEEVAPVDVAKTKAQQRTLDAAIAKKSRDLKKRQQKERLALQTRRKEALARIKENAAQEIARVQGQVRQEFRPQWEKMFADHQKALQEFEQGEKTFLGRVSNAVRSIDFGAILGGSERRRAISDAFTAFASSGKRFEAIHKKHKAKERGLERRQKRQERLAAAPARQNQKAERDATSREFRDSRAQLAITHQTEQAAVRSEWRSRRAERSQAWSDLPKTVSRDPGRSWTQPAPSPAPVVVTASNDNQDDRYRKALEQLRKNRLRNQERDLER